VGTYRTLTDEQVQSFLDKGYLVVKNCLDLEIAGRWIDQAYERLGYDKHDPQTWVKDIIWMDHQNQLPIRELAPRAWDAILDVLGGEDRIEPQVMEIESRHFTTINSSIWSDAFIVNFHRGADKPWQAPSPEAGGWHKDGSYFRHFLDSREQAVLTVVLWSDMRHQGGGTFIAPDSVGVVARYLAAHPEGVSPIGFGSLINQCHEFVELTGQAGDVVLHHPYMLHATSQNTLKVERAITNPPVSLKEPMNFNRDNEDDFSPLERGVLRGLGVSRLDFKPTTPRQRLNPADVHAEGRRLAEQAKAPAAK